MEDAATNCKKSVDSILKDVKSYSREFSNMNANQESVLVNALEAAWLAGRFYMNMKHIEEHNGSK